MSHSPHPLTTTAITTTASSTSQFQSTPVAAAVTVSPSINSTLSLTPPPRLHETAEATTTTIPTPGPAPGTEVIDLTEAFDTEEDLMLWRLEQDLVQLHQQYFNGLWQLQQQHRHASLQHERGQEVAKIDLLRGLMGKPMPGEQEEVYDVDITQPGREPHRQQQLQQPPQQQPRQSRDRSLPPLSDLFGAPRRQNELPLPPPDVVSCPSVADPFGGPLRQIEPHPPHPDVARIPYTPTGPIYEREGYNQLTASSILAQRDFPGRANSGHQQPSQGNIISSPYSTQHNQPANIPQDFGANPGSPPLSTHAYGQLYEDDHQYHPSVLRVSRCPSRCPSSTNRLRRTTSTRSRRSSHHIRNCNASYHTKSADISRLNLLSLNTNTKAQCTVRPTPAPALLRRSSMSPWVKYPAAAAACPRSHSRTSANPWEEWLSARPNPGCHSRDL
ncbi:hypothetical protein BGX23_006073 [Mortierella sp. AD031]|nr:hypothetical protein BGX23_006073 [Mortierella sp. AD031]